MATPQKFGEIYRLKHRYPFFSRNLHELLSANCLRDLNNVMSLSVDEVKEILELIPNESYLKKEFTYLYAILKKDMKLKSLSFVTGRYIFNTESKNTRQKSIFFYK